MTKEEFILIGYFPKLVAGNIFNFSQNPRAEWLKDINYICSVSCCISKAPPDWINKWKHNMTTWLYDSPESALAILPQGDLDRYRLFAYRILPYQFHSTGTRDIPYKELTVTQIPHRFACIGYDVVSGSVGSGGFEFECSPLSCNLMATEHWVNRYCLVDDFCAAVELGRAFAERGNCEPGPYNVVEVWCSEKIA